MPSSTCSLSSIHSAIIEDRCCCLVGVAILDLCCRPSMWPSSKSAADAAVATSVLPSSTCLLSSILGAILLEIRRSTRQLSSSRQADDDGDGVDRHCLEECARKICKRKQKQRGYTKYRELKHNNRNTYLMKSPRMASAEEEKR